MGCANRKSDPALPVILKKQSIHEKFSMNPHAEDAEAEIVDPGRLEERKPSNNMDVASNLIKDESKATLNNFEGLSQTINAGVYQKTSETDKGYLSNTMNMSNINPIEKPNFPNHEHKFDFDFLEEEKKENEEADQKVLDEMLNEFDLDQDIPKN